MSGFVADTARDSTSEGKHRSGLDSGVFSNSTGVMKSAWACRSGWYCYAVDIRREIQMPVGKQMREDVEEPMLARLATLRDPGTPDQIVMEQHNLTHFPSPPWCKMCVESRGHDSPHREQSKIDAVVLQLQFDHGYIGDGGPLQRACFLV